MESVSNIKWPTNVLNYVEDNSRTPRTSRLRAKEYVTTQKGDLRNCKPTEPVTDYWSLVELVSQIAALNTEYELFFRGQSSQHHNPNGIGHQLCPSLWRDRNDGFTFEERCSLLKDTEERLKKAYSKYDKRDTRVEDKMKSSPITRWALIQHYGIADTPLLDLTRSLQIACSFALEKGDEGYLYVLGLPFQREMLMTDSYAGLVNVSLLGVTPYNAKRPLAQDGYLAGGDDWWRFYASSTERYSGTRRVDFAPRIVVVFKIKDDGSFWKDSPAGKVPSDRLYPKDDAFLDFLREYEFDPYLPQPEIS